MTSPTRRAGTLRWRVITSVAGIVLAFAAGTPVAGAAIFETSISYPVLPMGLARPLAVADYTGDGAVDVVVGNLDHTQNLRIVPGVGDGTFGEAVPLPYVEVGYQVAHINTDDLPDLAAIVDSSPDHPMQVIVLLADGNGGFDLQQPHDLSSTRDGRKGAVFGDFDGDGAGDVAVATAGAMSTTVHLGLGNGDGGFAPTQPKSLPAGYAIYAAHDMTDDGRDDILAVGPPGSVTLVSTDAGFAPSSGPKLPFWPNPPRSAVFEDFDLDGFADVLVEEHDCLYVLWGDGTGDLETSPCVRTHGFAVGFYKQQTAVGHFDGDEWADVVQADLFNNGDRSFTLVLGGPLSVEPVSCGVGPALCEFPLIWDLNSDGDDDVLVGAGPGEIRVFLNEGRTEAAFDPTDEIDFEHQQIATAGEPIEALVFNVGDRPFSVPSATISGPAASDFRIIDTDCPGPPLYADELCGFLVQFTPSAVGPRSASLTIAHTAPGAEHSIQLSGVGDPRPASGPLSPAPAPTQPAPTTTSRGLTAAELLTALNSPRRVTVSLAHGRIRVGSLANPPVRSATLELTAKSKGARSARAVVIARANMRIPTSGRRAALLRMTRAGKRLIRVERRLRARLAIRAIDATGTPVKAATRVTLSLKRR